jgi:hypothetical protein
MEHRSVSVAPPNSLILIMDPSVAEIPESMGRSLISATPTCIAVGTRAEGDGETYVFFSTDRSSAPADLLVFDGVLRTPNREVCICNVLDERLLSVRVSMDDTHINIWADDDCEPGVINVVLPESALSG